MRFVVLAVAMLVACRDSDPMSSPSQGRGTQACRDWQDAICAYATHCGAATREECDKQYEGVTCKSDSIAESCQKIFENSACGRAAASCDLNGVADPGPAARACDALIERFCDQGVTCGVWNTQEDCRADPSVAPIDCGHAIAYGLDYEACLAEIPSLDCTLFQLPALCENVIVMQP
jgi:hypothetical protein